MTPDSTPALAPVADPPTKTGAAASRQRVRDHEQLGALHFRLERLQRELEAARARAAATEHALEAVRLELWAAIIARDSWRRAALDLPAHARAATAEATP